MIKDTCTSLALAITYITLHADYFEGKYLHQSQCKNNKAPSETSTTSHTVIGLGAAVVLLSILLLIVTGGWICTCWIMRKTTEIRYM